MAEDSGEQHTGPGFPEGERADSLDLATDVSPGDTVYFNTRSGSGYAFRMEEPAVREGEEKEPRRARGTLSGGSIRRRYSVGSVEGVEISGSIHPERGLRWDTLAQGMSVEMHVPRDGKMRLLTTSPVTEIIVSRDQRGKG